MVAPANRQRTWEDQSHSSLERMVDDFPVESMAVVFGVGIVTGLILMAALPESVTHMSRRESFAERIGNQIAHAVKQAIPDNVMSHFR